MQTYVVVTVLALTLVLGTVVAGPEMLHAHPGRTAADGCHYCRTNCDKWGVPWNERHCHGGSAPVRSAPVQSTPTRPAAPAGTLGQAAEVGTAYAVVEVVDGDTIKVRDTEGTLATVRLVGIDTPETVHPSKPVQCFGREASARLRQLLAGQKVYLAKDAIGDTRDKYQRLLRYVRVGEKGNDIGGQLIREGYAYAYTTYPFEKRQTYVAFQKGAEEKQVGLWAPEVCGNPPAAPAMTGTTTTGAVAGTSTRAATTSTVKLPSGEAPTANVALAAAGSAEPSSDTGAVVLGVSILALLGFAGWRTVRWIMVKMRRNTA
jgi:micrococcal nuclease